MLSLKTKLVRTKKSRVLALLGFVVGFTILGIPGIQKAYTGDHAGGQHGNPPNPAATPSAITCTTATAGGSDSGGSSSGGSSSGGSSSGGSSSGGSSSGGSSSGGSSSGGSSSGGSSSGGSSSGGRRGGGSRGGDGGVSGGGNGTFCFGVGDDQTGACRLRCDFNICGGKGGVSGSATVTACVTVTLEHPIRDLKTLPGKIFGTGWFD